MSYTLDELYSKQPTERLIVPFDSPHYPVVHIARWPKSSFRSHADFVRMTEMYDSAMQGLIQGMPQEQLTRWFMPHHDLHEPESIEDIDVIRIEDAAVWISRIFPFVQVPWLNTGDHTEVLSEVDDKFGELIAFGKAGYLYIFVADVL